MASCAAGQIKNQQLIGLLTAIYVKEIPLVLKSRYEYPMTVHLSEKQNS